MDNGKRNNKIKCPLWGDNASVSSGNVSNPSPIVSNSSPIVSNPSPIVSNSSGNAIPVNPIVNKTKKIKAINLPQFGSHDGGKRKRTRAKRTRAKRTRAKRTRAKRY